MSMSKWLGAASALALATLVSGGAMAADPVYEVVDTAYNWSGVYVGATIGYGGANVDGVYDASDGVSSFVNDDSGPFSLDPDGIVGGLEVGYNWQSGSFVYGVEGDVTFVDWSDSLTNDDDEKVSVDTDFVATLRARAGYAMDRTLLFATAGVAFTDTKYTANDDANSSGDSGSLDLNDVGVVAGGGVEYAFNDKWSVKAEGLYFWFNDSNDARNLTSDSDNDDFAKLKDAWLVRVGVNYHF